eukprot:135797_1
MALMYLIDAWMNFTKNENAISIYIRIFQCVIFLTYFVLTCVTINELYQNQLWLLFTLNTIFFLLPFFVLHVLCIITMIIEDDERAHNPLYPFLFTIEAMTVITNNYYAIIDKNPLTHCCDKYNNAYILFKIVNYFITSILFFVPVCFSPIISVILVVTNEEENVNVIGLYAQFGVVISNICVQIITFIISSHIISSIAIAPTVCFGIVELILMVFMLCYFLFTQSPKQTFLPFSIATELLLILSMIFVGIVHFDHLNDISVAMALFILTVVNLFFPNIFFLKSYYLNLYLNDTSDTSCFNYIQKETNTENQIDKLFCILLSGSLVKSHEKNEYLPVAIKEKNIIKQQYHYLKMNAKERVIFVENIFQSKYCLRKKIVYSLYIISSFIAFVSPIIWMVWIAIKTKYNEWDSLFALVFTIFYTLFGIVSAIILWKCGKISIHSIKYKLMLQEKKVTDMKMIDELFSRQPTVYFVLHKFQYDIGSIIISFLFVKSYLVV